MGNFRNFTESEINLLKSNGCSASDWSKVFYKGEFLPERLRNVSFSGMVRLGAVSGEIDVRGAGLLPCGIYNARLINTQVGDNCLIENIGGFISSYSIGNGVHISNCGKLYAEVGSSFGNGVDVNVLDETGGRSVRMFCGMSSQFAYMQAMYRHDPLLSESLKTIADNETTRRISNTGIIESEAKILGVNTLKSVYIGRSAYLDGCSRLENGTVLSSPIKPTELGSNVIAENFIVDTASVVSDGVNIENCFVGQGVVLSRGFSGSHSLFFANSHLENGEAVSVFAGPFTVSHHKSTLLIGLMCSYFNAGSGTNFSNHLYKSGPVHQGVLERGVKCGSGSYMMHPVKVGAFSTVIGHHTEKMDTSDLPFSCLIEEKDTTKVLPGINLKNIGLFRDEDKWSKRDKRLGEDNVDILRYELFTPFTAAKMIEGMEHLSDKVGKNYLSVASADVIKGIKLYRRALEYYIGKALLERLSGCNVVKYTDILSPETEIGAGEWIDLSGMIAPKSEVDRVLELIRCGNINSSEEFQKELAHISKQYSLYEWRWIYEHVTSVFDIDLKYFTFDNLKYILNKWISAAENINEDLKADACKEFSPKSTVSFGVDSFGDTDIIQSDIMAVRGALETSSLYSLLKHREDIVERFKNSF